MLLSRVFNQKVSRTSEIIAAMLLVDQLATPPPTDNPEVEYEVSVLLELSTALPKEARIELGIGTLMEVYAHH